MSTPPTMTYTPEEGGIFGMWTPEGIKLAAVFTVDIGSIMNCITETDWRKACDDYLFELAIMIQSSLSKSIAQFVSQSNIVQVVGNTDMQIAIFLPHYIWKTEETKIAPLIYAAGFALLPALMNKIVYVPIGLTGVEFIGWLEGAKAKRYMWPANTMNPSYVGYITTSEAQADAIIEHSQIGGGLHLEKSPLPRISYGVYSGKGYMGAVDKYMKKPYSKVSFWNVEYVRND